MRRKNEKTKKKPWTDYEDSQVMTLVEQYGPHKWTFIASKLPGRMGKQCRERWHNHLNPLIKKTPWEDQEEWLLFLYHRAIDNKWAEIAKHLEGRTDNAIKNHWNSGMKKRMPEFNDKLAKLKQMFLLQGSGFLESISNPFEKKALEIMFLNKQLSQYKLFDKQYCNHFQTNDLANNSYPQRSYDTDSDEDIKSLFPQIQMKNVVLLINHKEFKKHPRRNRMHKKYLIYRHQQQHQQKERDKENIIQNKLIWNETPDKIENNDYFQTPAAFNKMRQSILSNRKLSYSRQKDLYNPSIDYQEDLKQNLFSQ